MPARRERWTLFDCERKRGSGRIAADQSGFQRFDSNDPRKSAPIRFIRVPFLSLTASKAGSAERPVAASFLRRVPLRLTATPPPAGRGCRQFLLRSCAVGKNRGQAPFRGATILGVGEPCPPTNWCLTPACNNPLRRPRAGKIMVHAFASPQEPLYSRTC